MATPDAGPEAWPHRGLAVEMCLFHQAHLTRRWINRRRIMMQNTNTQSEPQSLHSGGEIPPVTGEPTGSSDNNEPSEQDMPTGALINTSPVAGTPSSLQPSDPHARLRTFLPQRGLYYATIAGVIAGVCAALLTVVITLVFAGTFHAASQQIAVDTLTVKTALA